jgi:hypothetical protein
VVAVESDGFVTAGEVVKQDTPEAWAAAHRWIEPKGREVISLVRTSSTATIRLGYHIDTLLASGWAKGGIRPSEKGAADD